MGERMTDQMPIAPKAAQAHVTARAGLAPPPAPLPMPKQALAPAQGQIHHAAARLMARLALLKHSFRRIG